MAAAAPARARKQLSLQERQVLLCVMVGRNDEQIGEILGLVKGTVASVINRIKHKLGVKYWGRWDLAVKLNAAMYEQFTNPRNPEDHFRSDALSIHGSFERRQDAFVGPLDLDLSAEGAD